MNLAELGAVTTVITGTMAGATAAHDQKAGWAAILFAVGGFAVSFGFALVSMKVADIALGRATRAGQKESVCGIAFELLYLLTPLFSIAAAVATVVFLTLMVLRLTQ
jgi:hypothetical protein